MQIQFNVPVEDLTTFRLPVKAACVVRYNGEEDLREILANSALPRPLKPIGEGSNLLFTKDFPGTLLLCDNSEANFVVLGGGKVAVEVAAGVVMDRLIEECCRKGLWGLENLSGIPGTAGAAVVQNVGAYGVEICDVLDSVTVLDTVTMQTVTFPAAELGYGYRTSLFKSEEWRGRYIVLTVKLLLSSTPAPRLGYANLRSLVGDESTLTPLEVRDAVIAMRDSKLPDPAIIGSAGSFFKNPVMDAEAFRRLEEENPGMEIPRYVNPDGSVKVPAAWLIDRCGLKGATSGGAAVWRKQPLVIVNATGDATPADVLNLEARVKQEVKSRFGIELSPEVEHL